MAEVTVPRFAVLDANVAIGTAKAGVFPLLRRLFPVVAVPPVALGEITDVVSQAAVQLALGDWLMEETPSATSMASVPRPAEEADREVLALALDHQPCVILSGDRGLISQARRMGIPTVSAPRVVQLLARAGLIPAARPHLDRMREQGFGVPDELYQEILASLDE